MRIIVNGQQAFGQAVLEALLKRGETVVGVYCGPDKEGRPVDPLKVYAQQGDYRYSSPPHSKKRKSGSKFAH